MDQEQVIEGFRQEETKQGPKDILSVAFIEGVVEDQKSFTDNGALGKPFSTARGGRKRAEEAVRNSKTTGLLKLEDYSSFLDLHRYLLIVQDQWKKEAQWHKGNHEVFRRLAQTLDGHNAFLNAFPDPQKYVSTFCRSLSVIVKGSRKEYSKPKVEIIIFNLIRISESVRAILDRVTIFKSDEIKKGVALIYSGIFQYLAGQIDIIPSSFTAKTLSRLGKAASDDSLATQVEDIIARATGTSPTEVCNMRRSTRVMDDQSVRFDRVINAVDGSRAKAEEEVRDLEIKQKDLEIKNLKSRLASDSKRAHVNDEVQRLLASNLVASQVNSDKAANIVQVNIEVISETPVASPLREGVIQSGLRQRAYKQADLQQYSQMLEEHIVGEELTTYLLDKPPAQAVSDSVFSRLHQWIGAVTSVRLWIAGPQERQYPSKMSTMASSVVKLLAQADPLVIFGFCELPKWGTLPPKTSQESGALLNLIYSLIRQLICRLESSFETDKDLSKERFSCLDGTVSTWVEAIGLFKDLVLLSSPYIICVIDGIDQIDYRDGVQGLQELLGVMEDISKTQTPLNQPGNSRVFKLLLTTSGKPTTLLRKLRATEMLLEDERRGSLDLGQPGPGRRGFEGLVESY